MELFESFSDPEIASLLSDPSTPREISVPLARYALARLPLLMPDGRIADESFAAVAHALPLVERHFVDEIIPAWTSAICERMSLLSSPDYEDGSRAVYSVMWALKFSPVALRHLAGALTVEGPVGQQFLIDTIGARYFTRPNHIRSIIEKDTLKEARLVLLRLYWHRGEHAPEWLWGS